MNLTSRHHEIVFCSLCVILIQSCRAVFFKLYPPRPSFVSRISLMNYFDSLLQSQVLYATLRLSVKK